MGDFNPTSQFLYHYTNENAYREILREKTLLKSSKDRDGTNHSYGEGVYLTSLQPDTERDKLKENNYDGAARKQKYSGKQDCYFKFNRRNLPGVKCETTKGDRDVWRFPNDIDLNKISFYHGYTDEPEYETYQQNNSPTSYDQMYLAKGNNSRGNDVYGSSQQQQEPESSGLGFLAGTAAVIAIGAAAFGLFAASRQANRNNQ